MSSRARALAGWRGLSVVIGLVVVIGACTQLTRTANNPTPTPSPSPTPTASPSPTPTLSPTPKPTPTPIPLNAELLNRRLTILVLGTDGNPERVARSPDTRTDAMILVSVNARHTIISMTSLPRDYVDIPLGNGQLWRSKVNGIAYAMGEMALVRALESTYQTKIDYYVEINMSDFGGLIQAIGGIDVNVPQAIYDPSIGFSISRGRHHMDGNTALSYARSRHTTSDYDRDARQQLILSAIMTKLLSPKTKVNMVTVLTSLRYFKTNMRLADMPTFFAIAKASAKATTIRKVLAPPTYASFSGMDPYGRGWISIPNLAAMRAWIRAAMRG